MRAKLSVRRLLVASLTLGLAYGALAVGPAAAKKKAKPVKTTFYLHGTLPVAEAEWPDTWLGSLWMQMDTTAPSDPAPKTMGVTYYVAGPNTNCSGNGLLPVWRGDMTGTVVGDVKVTIHTVATPNAPVVARLYPDASGGCNEAAQPPAAEVMATPPAGQGMTEFVFEGVKIPVAARLVLQLHMGGTGQVRILYDSPSAESTVEFTCLPAKGKKACAS